MTYKIFSFLGLVALSTLATGQVTTLSTGSGNDFVDRMLYNLRPQATKLGGDPWHVPEINLSFNYTFLFTDHVGVLNISDAYLIGLSMLERSGDCTLSYDFKMMQLTVEFVIKEILMDGAFSAHILGMEPSGNVYCHLEEQLLKVSFLIDVLESNVDLQHFETTNDKDMQIKIDGLGILGDPLANVVIGVVKTVLKNKIVSVISDNIGTALAEFVKNIHILPPIPDPTVVAPLFV